MDDLWDEPLQPRLPLDRPQPRESLQAEPLFLPGDEDDVVSSTLPPPQNNNLPPEVDEFDAILANLDDLIAPVQPSTETFDVEALVARHSKSASNAFATSNKEANSTVSALKETDPKGEKGEKEKPRKEIAKVDDERLIGSRGFPALIAEAKKFKPKGKGHEVEDLQRVLEVYQFWTHKMYPKTQFRDTVTRVERVCRSRRMLNNMSMWRDATNKPAMEEDIITLEDSDAEENEWIPNISKPSTKVMGGDTAIEIDESVSLRAPSDNHETRRPPETGPEPDDDEIEEWFNLDGPSNISTVNDTFMGLNSTPPHVTEKDIQHAVEKTQEDLAAAARGERILSPLPGPDEFEDIYA